MIEVGSRVEVPPYTDAWMRGNRYGVVARIRSGYATVRLDCSNVPEIFVTEDLKEV